MPKKNKKELEECEDIVSKEQELADLKELIESLSGCHNENEGGEAWDCSRCVYFADCYKYIQEILQFVVQWIYNRIHDQSICSGAIRDKLEEIKSMKEDLVPKQDEKKKLDNSENLYL